MQLFEQKSNLFGSIEYFKHEGSGNICISIDKQDAIVECQNEKLIRISSNSMELINKIRGIFL